ncbi:hypothetical protein BD289DRAFT_442046 [Coniella lustricola]|uniref:Copper acquisition factor BIM1-like domain-containing protein n=1 Tax=Coniella lustricola TaxID=2025994 RepID=A0A2T2ZYM1_9PEZI|nr:hypothetical protein BD289DRAFT_442046 [Coniella lustricola]
MHFMSSLATLMLAAATGATTHGEGDEGTIMGPVAFLWPENRDWTAAYDNTGPCGSSSGVTNRTEFPLTQGEVALSIADDAWKVAFYISFDNDPTAESKFTEQIVSNITEIVPGHQCYKIASIPSTVTAGSNATIQLEYWAHYEDENSGNNETFYACADIYFVEDSDFSTSIPCFNVTAESFGSTVTTTASVATVTSTSLSKSSNSSGLSKGAISGIAVGTIIGSLAIVGAVAFTLLKKRRDGTTKQGMPMEQDVSKNGGDASSVASAQ